MGKILLEGVLLVTHERRAPQEAASISVGLRSSSMREKIGILSMLHVCIFLKLNILL